MVNPTSVKANDQTEKQFDERVVHIDRVARVVQGGRRFHFRALVAIGDHSGKVGVGVAKGADVTAAVTKATEVAKKTIKKINIHNETIAHEAEVKHSGAHILIKPAGPGTGLIAGGVVRTVLEVAGIRNILSKSFGSTNKINAAYATIEALTSIEPVKNWNNKYNFKKISSIETSKDETKAKTFPKAASNKKITKKVK